MPLAYYLKQYFTRHKKHGSRDRKWITHGCYAYFRLGHATAGLPAESRLQAALLLAEPRPPADFFPVSWQAIYPAGREERLRWLEQTIRGFYPDRIFPWTEQLSQGMDHLLFNRSHLQQPDLFIRIRPGYEQTVRAQLASAGIAFRSVSGECLALANTTKLDGIVALIRQAVIQDYSSQRVGSLLEMIPMDEPLRVWDACAASGGKSILVRDKLPLAFLLVSDLRASVLQNLRQRFTAAGMGSYQTMVTDLSKPGTPRPTGMFDLVICDVPCSGSGTWSRTPEQLVYFREEQIGEYAALQEQIWKAVLPFVKPGGYLLYATCSVFTAENEMQVEKIAAEAGWSVLQQVLWHGYADKADTLFGALLQKQ